MAGEIEMAKDAKKLTVAAVQMESKNGAVEENLRRATGFAEEAAQRGAELIVFPEFMPTGYVFTPEIWDAGEPADGPTARWLAETSKRLGVSIGTSFLEAVGEDFLNTFLITGLDGSAWGKVRKEKPAAVEACYFKGEKNDHVIETDFAKIGVGICYENQLSFLPRLMCAGSVDLILMPHSAPSPTPTPLMRQSRLDEYAKVLEKMPPMYASRLGVPVVYINKSGPFRSPVPGMPFYRQDSRFPGTSTIVDSDGKVLERLGLEEGIAVATVSLDPARKTCTAWPGHGRWSLQVPWEISVFVAAEACGRGYYAMKNERRRKALEISSREGARREE